MNPRGVRAAANILTKLHRVHLTITIPADHPSLAGHFPGRPIVPGAVILAEIIAAACAALGDVRITGLPAVKFMYPLLPDQRCELSFTDKGNGGAAFELSLDGRRLASGQLAYQRVAEA
jgi:3-hydroxymyristoyl/3-hydroxydecanoyl-(acyl carrier protein) dehydratase